ncbi:CO dehydrogenase/acetyl-CoA synthase subunit delta [[Eubacterium] cellulosolvens]
MTKEIEEHKSPLEKLGPRIIEILSQMGEIELEDVEMELSHLEFDLRNLPSRAAVTTKPPSMVKPRPEKLLAEKFKPPTMEYPDKIVEVTVGATKSEGGSRDRSITIGGEMSPPFYLFERPPLHPPAVAIDVFDTKLHFARAVRMHVEDVVEDPGAWASRAVKKWGADTINLHLVGIDPLIKNTSPKEASNTVEQVLQAVKVPLAIGGCGDPEKDTAVFTRIAEDFKGERLLFNSVTLDMDIEKNAKTIAKNGHTLIAFTPMDMDKARELNRKIYPYIEKDRIVIDTTTAALGYGLDYAFTIMERTRLAGLMGDTELQHPLSSGTTNAWAAREAWMEMDPKWGQREFRGPLWETVTAIILLLAGVDYFMMMHPAAVKTLKDLITEFCSNPRRADEHYSEWVTMKPER